MIKWIVGSYIDNFSDTNYLIYTPNEKEIEDRKMKENFSIRNIILLNNKIFNDENSTTLLNSEDCNIRCCIQFSDDNMHSKEMFPRYSSEQILKQILDYINFIKEHTHLIQFDNDSKHYYIFESNGEKIEIDNEKITNMPKFTIGERKKLIFLPPQGEEAIIVSNSSSS